MNSFHTTANMRFINFSHLKNLLYQFLHRAYLCPKTGQVAFTESCTFRTLARRHHQISGQTLLGTHRGHAQDQYRCGKHCMTPQSAFDIEQFSRICPTTGSMLVWPTTPPYHSSIPRPTKTAGHGCVRLLVQPGMRDGIGRLLWRELRGTLLAVCCVGLEQRRQRAIPTPAASPPVAD